MWHYTKLCFYYSWSSTYFMLGNLLIASLSCCVEQGISIHLTYRDLKKIPASQLPCQAPWLLMEWSLWAKMQCKSFKSLHCRSYKCISTVFSCRGKKNVNSFWWHFIGQLTSKIFLLITCCLERSSLLQAFCGILCVYIRVVQISLKK